MTSPTNSAPDLTNRRENPERNAPRGHGPSDHAASMQTPSQDPRPDDLPRSPARPQDPVGDAARGDALLRWDELDEELLRMLAEDPRTGQHVRKLREADDWLRGRAREAARRRGGPELLVCPPAEELFDFGNGPGAGTLTPERRAAIDRHLATCRECESFVGTLASRPPSPLLVEGLPAEPAPRPAPILRPADAATGPRRSVARGMFGPIAAAAAALLAVVVLDHAGPRHDQFPAPVVLRGVDGGKVWFPRGRVLIPSPSVRELLPGLGQPPAFEVEPQPDAERYRFVLERASVGAFDTASAVDAAIESSKPTAEARTALPAGEYLLTAWAVVRGLDRPLGSRGFRVQADVDLDARLLELRDLRGVERTMAAIHLLDERGYVVDAHTLAATLPQSAERDAYLAQPRGR